MTPTDARPRLRSRRRDRGAVIPLVALALTTLMIGTAFSVDLGRLRAARRDLQADADFLALDAASVLNGLTADEAMPLVVAEANASALRNQYDFEPVTSANIVLGTWDLNTFTPVNSGSDVPTAVEVTLTDAVDMLFDFSTDERRTTRTAIGVDHWLDEDLCEPPDTDCPTSVAPVARAELGSFLARLESYQQPSVDPAFNLEIERQLSFANHIFTEFLGINVPGGVDFGAGVTGDADPITGPATGLRLDAVSYKGLADGLVSIDQLADQMAVNGALSAGTVDELLASDVKVADLLSAAATVLSASPRAADVTAGSILGDIAAAVDSTLTMQFGRFMQATTGQGSALETFVSADELLLGTVSVINGRNFVDATIPVNLPGVPPTLLARITVIEPPQTHKGFREAGRAGPSTAQIKVEVNVPVSALNIDLNVINGLLGVITRNGNIPLTIEVAKAESVYDAMACPTETQTSWTDLQVENGGVAIGMNAQSAGILATAGAIGLSATAMVHGSVDILGVGVDLEAMTDVDHKRTWSEGVPYSGDLTSNSLILQNVDTLRHLGPLYGTPWLQYPSGAPQAASTDTTFGSITFNSSGLESGLHAALSAAIIDAFQPVMDQIDAALADPLLQSMGVTLAGSDARIQKLRCRGIFLA